jgi:DNA-binding GntR family transcriptional regulator
MPTSVRRPSHTRYRTHSPEVRAVSDAFALLGSSRRTGALPSRTEAVLEAIKRGIVTGDLKPGQALVETELAERLGVSKTPVLEALKTLAGTGLVVMLPYKGATVREADKALASAAGPFGAERVGRHRRRGRPVAGQPRLHRALYAGCGNPLLVKTLDELRDQTALVSGAAWARRLSWEQEAREHRALLQAAEHGDRDQVRALMRGRISAFLARNFPEKPRNGVAGQ